MKKILNADGTVNRQSEIQNALADLRTALIEEEGYNPQFIDDAKNRLSMTLRRGGDDDGRTDSVRRIG